MLKLIHLKRPSLTLALLIAFILCSCHHQRKFLNEPLSRPVTDPLNMQMNPGSLAQKSITAIPKKVPDHEQPIPEDSFTPDSANCDVIILRNGDEIKGKVLEITLTEVKYKKCDNLNGPTISLRKQDVFIIKYPNGTKEVINNGIPQIQPDFTSEARSSPEAIAGLIFALAAIPFILFSLIAGSFYAIIGGIILAIGGFMLSIVALDKMKRNPNKYRGDGLAIAGLILGILCTIVGVLGMELI